MLRCGGIDKRSGRMKQISARLYYRQRVTFRISGAGRQQGGSSHWSEHAEHDSVDREKMWSTKGEHKEPALCQTKVRSRSGTGQARVDELDDT